MAKRFEAERKDVFRGACLLQVETSVWTPRRRVPKAVVEARLREIAADPAMAAAVGARMAEQAKYLVDPAECRELNRLRNKAHTTIYGISVPFPINGCSLVSHEMVEEADRRLEEVEGEIKRAARDLGRRFAGLVDAARVILEPAGLWDPDEYPEDVSSECTVDWRFLRVAEVDANLAEVAPAVARRERARLEGLYAEAAAMATAALKKEFGERLRHVVDRLSPSAGGEARRFNDGLVDGFREWFELFRKRNVWGDADLGELVDRAKAILGGASADDLRGDDGLAARVAGEMARVEDALLAGTSARGRRVRARKPAPAGEIVVGVE